MTASSAVPVADPGLTWADFLALPGEQKHAELLDGEVVVSPPSRLHQWVVGRLHIALSGWADAAPDRGQVALDPPVQVGPRRGYLPDLAWFPQAQCGPRTESFSGVPALAVEVLSPSNRGLEMLRKRTDYARVGVEELWVVDPLEPSALIFRLPPAAREYELVEEVAADGELTSPLLPGLRVPLIDVI